MSHTCGWARRDGTYGCGAAVECDTARRPCSDEPLHCNARIRTATAFTKSSSCAGGMMSYCRVTTELAAAALLLLKNASDAI